MSEQSGIGTLNWTDVKKGIIMAILTGITLPVIAAVQTPGFDIFQANWSQIFNLAINGALIGGVSYLVKNVFTGTNGKLFGKI